MTIYKAVRMIESANCAKFLSFGQDYFGANTIII